MRIHVNKKKISTLLIIFLIIFLNFIIGCTSNAKSINMIPDKYKIENQHKHSVKLDVTGGKETNPLWASQISDENFMKALEESIKRSEVFSKVIKNGEAEYMLKVSIRNLEQPAAGFSMEVNLVTIWELTDMELKKVIWKDIISSNYTAGATDAFVGTTRMRMAIEGAGRKNIRMGISELSHLNL